MDVEKVACFCFFGNFEGGRFRSAPKASQHGG